MRLWIGWFSAFSIVWFFTFLCGGRREPEDIFDFVITVICSAVFAVLSATAVWGIFYR